MIIHLIWAQDNSGGIGKMGKLPWKIPEDLYHFKKLTINSTIIMGRKTWESLPKKPLPKRRNIVLSSKRMEDVECYNSIENCIKTLKNDKIKKVFVIGGAKVYKNFIFFADELHITYVNKKIIGIDTFLPFSKDKINNTFKIVKEYELSKNALYTHWIKIIN